MKTMKLTIFERLMLLSILPGTGSYTMLKLMREFREALSFSEAEHKALNLREEQDEKGMKMVKWNPEVVSDKEVQIGDTVKDAIVKELKSLDKQNLLTNELLPIYERFINERKEQ